MLKRVIAFIGILVLIVVPLVVSLTGADAAPAAGSATYSSTIIVGYRDGTTAVIDVPSGMSMEALIREYLSDPDVAYAEADHMASMTSLTPNDSFYKVLQKNAFNDMSIPEAWDITGGSSDIVVAVLDTGVDAAHPDLAGRVLSDGYDFVNNRSGASDDNGHGTMCAGIIAAGVNNEIGLAGATQGCMILPVKVLDAKGNGLVSNIASGIIFAADHGADVINLSLGCPDASQKLQDAVNYAYGKGIIVIAATGNTGAAIQYPAACSHAVAVGSVNTSNVIAKYSNYGSQQALVAVGSGILSTSLNEGYSVGSGTSFAAPFVSSLAALLLSVNSDYTPDELKEIMQKTAVDLGDTGWDQHYGYGCINFSAALLSVIPDAPEEENTAQPEEENTAQPEVEAAAPVS